MLREQLESYARTISKKNGAHPGTGSPAPHRARLRDPDIPRDRSLPDPRADWA